MRINGRRPQKESPALFQRRSLVEHGNFYILGMRERFRYLSKHFHCPVLIIGYRFICLPYTGKTPKRHERSLLPHGRGSGERKRMHMLSLKKVATSGMNIRSGKPYHLG